MVKTISLTLRKYLFSTKSPAIHTFSLLIKNEAYNSIFLKNTSFAFILVHTFVMYVC